MAGFPIELATRIKTLPPYLFAAIDKMKQEAIARGVDIINLGVGDPDLPTPAPIIERMKLAAAEPRITVPEEGSELRAALALNLQYQVPQPLPPPSTPGTADRTPQALLKDQLKRIEQARARNQELQVRPRHMIGGLGGRRS